MMQWKKYMKSLANRLLFLYLCMRFAETLWTFKFSKKMKITIINTEKSEKRYAREELDAFVSQLKDGTYCQQYIRDFKKDVCFAAEWVKTNGELKAKSFNPLVRRPFAPYPMPSPYSWRISWNDWHRSSRPLPSERVQTWNSATGFLQWVIHTTNWLKELLTES